ncbi:VOC family protein [Methylocella sp.]|uniref:VOC family protein n=1 Tax=Methylocella sp. TaxID=1978226 RepID=UPI003783D5E1
MAGRITNFEIYGDHPEQLATFYRELLGWRVERAAGVDYWRISADAEGSSPAAGGIARRPSFAQAGWLNFVEVPSLADALEAAVRLGGSILKEKTATPRVAWHAVIGDPAGNAFLVWQADPLAFPTPEPD